MERRITASDIEASVEAYDPNVHRAPFTLGHPRANGGPAYGYAANFTSPDGGENLYAEPAQVPADFAEWVKDGHLLSVSMSFYPPGHDSNPKPGAWYPRHVGFLGDEAPAVKGLDWPEFSEDDEGVATFVIAEFSEDDPGSVDFGEGAQLAGIVARAMRNLREWLIDTQGTETADEILQPYVLDDLNRVAYEQDAPFSESHDDPTNQTDPDTMPDEPTEQERADFQEERDALEQERADFQEEREAFREQQRKDRRQANADFAEAAADEGHILPRDIPVVEGVLNALGETEDAPTVDFSERGGDEETPAADAFRRFVDALDAEVNFSEASEATNERAAQDAPPADFQAPQGEDVSDERARLHSKAKQYQQQHDGASYTDAVKAVS